MRVLFISPIFYEYPTKIQQQLELLGMQVDFFPMDPENLMYWIIKRGPSVKNLKISRIITKKWEENIQNKILRKVSNNKYDILFVINGEHLHRKFLLELKKCQPEMRCYKYHWDEISKVIMNFDDTHDLFDQIFSFERNDCEKYGLTYLPLFYTREYGILKETKEISEDIDLLFVGQYHTDRYKVIKEIKRLAEENSLNIYIYLKIKPLRWIERRIFDPEFKKAKLNDFKFTSIDQSELLKLFQRSKVVLDLQATWQNGLTMRTFETLGAGKKLITSNKTITKEKFFYPELVRIIDRNDVSLDKSFIQKNEKDHDFSAYSLKSWLKIIFSIN